MTKLVAILFSTLILFQSSNISSDDLSKLHVLLEHAKYHEATYGDSFIDFLAEHYDESKEQHDFDHEEHQNLPFKHHQQCTHISHDFTVTTSYFLVTNYPNFLEIPVNFFYQEPITSFEKRPVLQPPKYA